MSMSLDASGDKVDDDNAAKWIRAEMLNVPLDDLEESMPTEISISDGDGGVPMSTPMCDDLVPAAIHEETTGNKKKNNKNAKKNDEEKFEKERAEKDEKQNQAEKQFQQTTAKINALAEERAAIKEQSVKDATAAYAQFLAFFHLMLND